MLKTLETRMKEIQELAMGNITNELLLSIPASYVKKWNDCIGKELKQGSVVSMGNIKYLVLTDVQVELNESPDLKEMINIYKPYRQDGIFEWLFGEYCEAGVIREYNDKRYTAKTAPGANLTSPDISGNWVENVE